MQLSPFEHDSTVTFENEVKFSLSHLVIHALFGLNKFWTCSFREDFQS